VEVGGSIITVEGVIARFVEIGRRGKVRGPIRAAQVIIGRDARAEDIYGAKILIRNGAHAENIYGENVTIESDCYIDGEVKYTDALKTGKDVYFKNPPEKVERLPE
jgi:cytoskeletal protein CcmA (bactofilin family)